MKRILANGDWYDPISQTALYEREYEDVILEQSASLFPQYYAMRFKKLVSSEEASARADLALIHKSYTKWWVCEVEMGDHSFEEHVDPQVKTLSRAAYSPEVADYLCKQCEALDLNRTKAMLKGEQPRVLVIVNTPMPQWLHDLRRYDARVMFIEVFRSDVGQQVYLSGGDAISEDKETVSRCVMEPLLANMLHVKNPGALTVGSSETVEIYFNGGVTVWRRTDIADAVYLTALKTPEMEKGAEYDLVEQDSGDLIFRAAPVSRKKKKE